jgi:flagellar FliL protein
MEELIDPDEGEESGKGDGKKSTLIVTIVGVLIASVIAAGGGWFVGGLLAPQSLEMQAAATAIDNIEKNQGDEEEEIPIAGEEGPNLIRLQPITTNLAFPSDSWVRLEVSLVVKGEPDIEMVELIHQDMLGYLRTLSLQQIQGARGFRYIREDLRERAVLRSRGNVENILVRTFVIE